MRTYQCKTCGYRKLERDMFDYMNEGMVYPNFNVSSMLPFMNTMRYETLDQKCPYCKSREGWQED